jgi:hypothetical protein
LLDFSGSLLRGFQVLDECRVAKDIFSSRRQSGQEIVLEALEHYFEIVLLLRQLSLEI